MRTSKKKEFPVHILFRNIIISKLYHHTIYYNDIFLSWFAGVWTNARVNRSLSCVYIMLVHFMGGIRKCVSAVLCRCVARYSSQGSLLPSNGIKHISDEGHVCRPRRRRVINYFRSFGGCESSSML